MSATLTVVTFRIRGLTPTIMDNGQMANPLNEFTKAAKAIYDTKQRGKPLPDEKMAELLRIGFLGGLYLDDDEHPCWPGENIEAMLVSAAKKLRQGPTAKVAVMSDGNWPLEYDGPKDPEKLWGNEDFRLVQMAIRGGKPVLTCRPIFRKWEMQFDVAFDADRVNESTVREWVTIAGHTIGLSDWRPKYGRFEII